MFPTILPPPHNLLPFLNCGARVLRGLWPPYDEDRACNYVLDNVLSHSLGFLGPAHGKNDRGAASIPLSNPLAAHPVDQNRRKVWRSHPVYSQTKILTGHDEHG